MLRRAPKNFGRLVQAAEAQSRFLYVPTRTRKPKSPQLDEIKDLDLKLKDIRQQEIELRTFLKRAQEKEALERIKKFENLELEAPANSDDVAMLESGFDTKAYNELFSPVAKISEPMSERIEASSDLNDNWDTQLEALQANGGFTNLPVADVQQFVALVDLKKNKHLTPVVDRMTTEANLNSPVIAHNLMAGYSSLANVERVEQLAATVKPSPIVFGHLAKANFKRRDLEGVTSVIRRMEAAGLKPTRPIYTMVLQTFVQQNKINDAFALFDNLKYLSSEHQPDTPMYNTMMLAASKTHNINKVLDLYQEMTTRPIDPLEPNEETLNVLVYASSRDEKTTLKAWDYFLELQHKSPVLGRNSLKALLYLCGQTGELVLLRKLLGQLCTSPNTYPDDFMINCLFLGYLNYDPSKPSALATPAGNRVRSEILQAVPVANSDFMPPFLPVDELSNEMIYAEARAMVTFFSEHTRLVPGQASASLGVPVLFNMLRIAKERGTLELFRECWDTFTKPHEEVQVVQVGEIQAHPEALVRDQDLYKLGIQAAAAFHSGELADAVWQERGQWRKTSGFQAQSRDRKKQMDVGFAKEMVSFFVAIGDTESALQLVKSTVRQFRWRRHHLEPLLELAAKQEDFEVVLAVRNLLRRYYEREERLADAARVPLRRAAEE